VGAGTDLGHGCRGGRIRRHNSLTPIWMVSVRSASLRYIPSSHAHLFREQFRPIQLLQHVELDALLGHKRNFSIGALAAKKAIQERAEVIARFDRLFNIPAGELELVCEIREALHHLFGGNPVGGGRGVGRADGEDVGDERWVPEGYAVDDRASPNE
jgi:hypothetical protein